MKLTRCHRQLFLFQSLGDFFCPFGWSQGYLLAPLYTSFFSDPASWFKITSYHPPGPIRRPLQVLKMASVLASVVLIFLLAGLCFPRCFFHWLSVCSSNTRISPPPVLFPEADGFLIQVCVRRSRSHKPKGIFCYLPIGR